jgi:hypothetical protein
MREEITRTAADYSHFSRRVDLWFVGENNTVAELIFSQYKEGSYVTPSASLTEIQAQALMDQLWQCGLRPTEGSGSAGSLAATERHLADMRTIVSKCLKTEL